MIFLYRFERADRKRAKTLSAGMLWASKPKHFNDLTDCQLNFDAFSEPPWAMPRLAEAVDLLYPNGELPEDLPLTPEMFQTLRRQLSPLGSGLKETAWRALAQVQLRESIASSVAACCFFGESYPSSLMWAHYGDNHRGMCVEYEVTADEPADLHLVEYSSRLPTITVTELLFSPWEAVLRVVRTKHLDWAYERERRIIFMGKPAIQAEDGFAFNIPPWLRPTRLIIGARVDPKLRIGQERPMKSAQLVASALNLPIYQIERKGQEISEVLRYEPALKSSRTPKTKI